MKTKGLGSKQFKLSLIATFVIMATVPFALYSILTGDSFDTGSDASEEIQPVTCEIRFPYINPTSIPQDGLVQLHLNANENGGATVADYEEIISIDVKSELSGILINKTYKYEGEENSATINEAFQYKSSAEGIDLLTGIVTSRLLSGETKTYECAVISPLADNKITILSANLPPLFTTNYSEAKPSNVLGKGDTYSYTLKATDPEGDTISYHYSFTPGSAWLKMSVVKDGTGGDLELKFQGVADGPAGYLANVFIHDGYQAHLSNQAWVISVEQGENDTPVVKITNPQQAIAVTQGESVTVNWTATDLNQILTYNVYYTTDPGNRSSWKKIDDLSNKFGGYVFDTSLLAPDSYFFVVEATDNYNPPATGYAISPKVTIGAKPVVVDPEEPVEPEEPIDGPVLKLPEIKNISPTDGSKLKNNRPTISATMVAGKDYQVKQSTVKITLDGKDVTKDANISKITASEYRLIYRPDANLKSGAHKVEVSFSDSNSKSAEKSWNFVIESQSEDVFTIFGFEIPKQTAIIFGIGLLILLAALAVPWILYAAWKNTNDDESKYSVYDLPPSSYGNYDNSKATNVDTSKVYNPDATFVTTNNYSVDPQPVSQPVVVADIVDEPADTYVNTSVGLAPDYNSIINPSTTPDYSANYTPYDGATDYEKAPQTSYAETDFQTVTTPQANVTTETVTPEIIYSAPAKDINQAFVAPAMVTEPTTTEVNVSTPAPESAEPTAVLEPVAPLAAAPSQVNVYINEAAQQPVSQPTQPQVDQPQQPIFATTEIDYMGDTSTDLKEESMPNDEELNKLASALEQYKEESKDPYAFLDDVDGSTDTQANASVNAPTPNKQPGADAV